MNVTWQAVLTTDYKKQNNHHLAEHVIFDIQLFKQDAHSSASTHIAHRMVLGLTASVDAKHRNLKCTPSTNLPKSMGSRQDDTAWTVRKCRTIKILFHSFTLRPHDLLNNAVRAIDRVHVWTSVFDDLLQGTDKHPAKHQTIRENRLNLFTIASPFEKAKSCFFEPLFWAHVMVTNVLRIKIDPNQTSDF